MYAFQLEFSSQFSCAMNEASFLDLLSEDGGERWARPSERRDREHITTTTSELRRTRLIAGPDPRTDGRRLGPF